MKRQRAWLSRLRTTTFLSTRRSRPRISSYGISENKKSNSRVLTTCRSSRLSNRSTPAAMSRPSSHGNGTFHHSQNQLYNSPNLNTIGTTTPSLLRVWTTSANGFTSQPRSSHKRTSRPSARTHHHAACSAVTTVNDEEADAVDHVATVRVVTEGERRARRVVRPVDSIQASAVDSAVAVVRQGSRRQHLK
jgi:hypothetical protein